MTLQFKVADDPAEFEQVHRLNYKTFVEEIPQHAPSENKRRVDPFHDENDYILALNDKKLVGMAAIRGKRPFSLDKKLPDLDDYIPPGRRVCEIRLLAVEREFRQTRVFYGLMKTLAFHARQNNYDMAVISGTLRQEKLYRHMGFVPFGPRVGTDAAFFQPMSLTWEDLRTHCPDIFPEPLLFLPGPVQWDPAIQGTLTLPPLSHRAWDFRRIFDDVKYQLLRLTSARHVNILAGSGTLANEAVAAQLSLLSGTGLVIVQGEFGRRLADHAARWKMNFKIHSVPEGAPIDEDDLASALSGANWLWTVHCETSTGVLNDLNVLTELCRRHGIRLAVDAISSLGTVPVDLSGVYLASGVSGKGLASCAGLSFVFYNHLILPSADIPRCLDLGLYNREGIPFTLPSVLLRPLNAALRRFAGPKGVLEDLAGISRYLRRELAKMNVSVLADENISSPAVITLPLPRELDAGSFGDGLKREGIHISYESAYLREKNWVQICLMKPCAKKDIDALLLSIKNRYRSPRGNAVHAYAQK